MNKARIKHFGNYSVSEASNIAFMFRTEVTNPRDDFTNSSFPFANFYERNPLTVAGIKILPNGYDTLNSFSHEIRQILENNGMVAGLTRAKDNLQWGYRPFVYREEIRDAEIIRIPVKDTEVESWLRSWNWRHYLLRALIDFNRVESHYTKFVQTKGSRIGRGRIARLEHVSVNDARLGFPEDGQTIRNIYVGDWEHNGLAAERSRGIYSYPVLREDDPLRSRIAMSYNFLPSFGRQFYPLPSWFGARKAIQLISTMPITLINYLKTGISPKFLFKVPQSYWDNAVENILKPRCLAEKIEFTYDILDDYKTEVFTTITDVLSGIENVGKLITTETFYTNNGIEGWEIEAIDNKTRDFFSSILDTYKTFQFAATNAFAIPTGLSNISTDGNLSSGSEILYSLKLYISTNTAISEMIICDPINLALRTNFPDKDLQIGFYHQIVNREENVSPEKRIKENV